MRRLRTTLLALAVAFAGSGAASQPFTSGLDAVTVAVTDRLVSLTGDLTGDEAKQKRALDRAIKALSRPSRSVEKDLALAAVLSKILDGAFPGDGTFGPALDGALAGFRSDLASLLIRLSVLGDTLPDGAARNRAAAGIDAAYQLAGAADAASTRTDRARLLGRAFKTVSVAVRPAVAAAIDFHGRDARDLRLGVGDVSQVIDGVPLDSIVSIGLFFPRSGGLILAGVDVHDLSTGEARVVLLVLVGVHGPGVYPLTTIDAEPMAQVLECPSTDTCVVYGTRTSGPYIGTLDLTTLDLERRLAEGTFTFTAADPFPGTETRTVMNGSFRVGLGIRR